MTNVNTPSFTSSNGPHATSSDSTGSRSFGDGRDQAPEVLQGVAQGAHQTIDRLTERVGPRLQRLQADMSVAGQTLEARADQLRNMSDEWTETLRCTVRDNPLTAVGVAWAVGMLMARLSR